MEQDSVTINNALKQVLTLFDIEDIRIEVLLPRGYKCIPQLIKNCEEENGKDVEAKVKTIAVYFDFLKNELKNDKWELDTYSFWCGFLEKLGIGYEGSDVIQLVKKIKCEK